MGKRLLSLALIVSLALGALVPSALANQPSDWALSYVNTAKSKEIGRTLFDYKSNITREQFAGIMVDVIEHVEGEKKFPTVRGYFRDIQSPRVDVAHELGIVNGVGNYKFEPQTNVTREQMSVMVNKVLMYFGEHKSGLSNFTDNWKISGWAKSAVDSMVGYGIIKGMPDGSFQPQGWATQEQSFIVADSLSTAVKSGVTGEIKATYFDKVAGIYYIRTAGVYGKNRIPDVGLREVNILTSGTVVLDDVNVKKVTGSVTKLELDSANIEVLDVRCSGVSMSKGTIGRMEVKEDLKLKGVGDVDELNVSGGKNIEVDVKVNRMYVDTGADVRVRGDVNRAHLNDTVRLYLEKGTMNEVYVARSSYLEFKLGTSVGTVYVSEDAKSTDIKSDIDFRVETSADLALDKSKKLRDALNAITEEMILNGNVDLYEIVKDLHLPAQVKEANLYWESSNLAVVDRYGKVKRGKNDVRVILTVYAEIDGRKDSKDFRIWVMAEDGKGSTEKPKEEDSTDSSVNDARNALTADLIKGGNDSLTSVKSDLTLVSSVKGISVSWSSSNTGAVSNSGVVTRGASDVSVTLTATLSKTGVPSATKNFSVVVVGTAVVDDESRIASAKEMLTWDLIRGENTSQDAVSKDLVLPKNIGDGVVLSWVSSETTSVNNLGGVITKKDEVSLTLTAYLTRGSKQDSKVFNLKVAINSDYQDVEAAKALLTWDLIKKDNDEDEWWAFGDLDFPDQIGEEVLVEWIISDTDIINPSGAVEATGNERNVFIEVRLTKNGYSSSEFISIKVQEHPDITLIKDFVNNFDFSIILNGNIDFNGIKTDLNLPVSAGEIDLKWGIEPGKEDIISKTGVVTRKSEDKKVKIGFSASKGGRTVNSEVIELTVLGL